LQVICDEAFRCKQIILKLLTLAKPGTGVREPVAVAPALADVEIMVRGLSRFARRTLQIKYDETNPLYALTNETELKQVLLNLVVKALEAVVDESGAVTVEAVRRGETIQITVSDNGRGMSAEVLEHVFEPFFTDKVDRADKNVAPGTGL